MKLLDGLLRVTDPRKVIACYTVFLVVRAVETEDTLQDTVMFCAEPGDCELPLGTRVVDVLDDFDFLDEDKSTLLVTQEINSSYHEDVEEAPPPGQLWGRVFVPRPSAHSQCEHQVHQYLRDLHNLEFWAMQMWDATAKPASGLLSGNGNQLGDYDSCLGVELAALGTVRGKYCLAELDVEVSAAAPPSVREAVNKLQAGAFVRSKHTNPGHFAPRWSTLRWGLCVPSECNDTEVLAGLQDLLQDYQLPGVTLDVAIKPGMCYTSQPGYILPFHTIVTLGCFGGILMLAVVSTMVDNINDYPRTDELKTRDRALLAFSVRRNWEALVSTRADSLPVIHGVRSVFTVMLFAAHKLMPLALIPYSNRSLLTQCSHSVFSAILRASSVFTDSFLQLSAVLTAYNLSQEMRKHGTIAWRSRVLARFIRLTPAMLAVVVFYAYVMEHLGAGPQWYSSITVNADLCKNNMWRNLFYVQNFYLFEDMCAPHTHQLALDMQLFLMAPLVIYCLHYWPRPALYMLVLSQLAVATLRYHTFLQHYLSDFIYHNISLTDLYRNANLTYSQAVYRAIPYTVGLVTGFFLHRVTNIPLSHRHVVAGWLLCALLATLSVFYPSHLARPGAVYDVSEGAWYAAISPIAWSTSLAWLIIACSSGNGGWLNRLLCHHWMVVLSRLSYAIYLTQFIIFFYYVGSVRSSQEFSLFYTIGVYEVVGILLASLFVTLLFDLPMQEIKSILLPGGKRAKLGKVS